MDIDQKKDTIIEMARELTIKFIDKVESGRAQSVETYKECQDILNNILALDHDNKIDTKLKRKEYIDERLQGMVNFLRNQPHITQEYYDMMMKEEREHAEKIYDEVMNEELL